MTLAVRLMDPVTRQEYAFEPARDIAYFWPQLLETVVESLKEEKWEPWIGDYLRYANVTEKEVMETVEAYVRFCSLAVAPHLKHPIDALEESGFLSKPKPAQLAVCARLSQICTMAFWHGIRTATKLGDTPVELVAMRQLANDLGDYITAKWSNDGTEKSDKSQTETPVQTETNVPANI